MSTTNNITSRIVLDDFKAGIFSDYHSSVAPTTATTATFDPKINGAAVIEDTWGCCADRSGALVPLPKVAVGKTQTLTPTPEARGSALPGNYLLDAVLVEQILEVNIAPTTEPEVVIMDNFIGFNSSVNSSYIRVRRHEQFRTVPETSDVCFTRSPISLDAANIASGNLTPARGVVNEASLTNPAAIRKGFVFVARPAQRADAVESGTEFVTGDIGATDRTFTDYDDKNALDSVTPGEKEWPEVCKQSLFGYFPNFDTPTGTFPNVTGFLNKAASEDYRGGFMCVGHQGRIVVAQRLASRYNGATANQFTYKDRLSATALLEMDRAVVSGEFVEENTAGIGMIASLSADELLVIKHSGGGYLLRGSVASPTVTKLPFLESTYGLVSTPALTPMGLVYGTRNGVFAWEGGETSKHISPQLDGFFWNHAGATKYDGHRARLGFWHPWVMVPNGFMLDTRHNSWWRLDDPSGHEAYNVFQVSENNRLYAFPWRQLTGTTPAWMQAEADVLASSWSWKSQPLVETRDQAFKLRDMTVLATATDPGSTITVTISGFDNTGTLVSIPAETITLGAAVNRPQMVLRDLGAQASALSYMQVRLQGAATGGGAAPKLHSVSFGVLDTKPVPKS